MKVNLIPMDKVSETPEGKRILSIAYENNSQTITQRLLPSMAGEDEDGGYLLMLLDWPNGMIIRLVFDGEEVVNLTNSLKSLAGMKVLDGFSEEGATRH